MYICSTVITTSLLKRRRWRSNRLSVTIIRRWNWILECIWTKCHFSSWCLCPCLLIGGWTTLNMLKVFVHLYRVYRLIRELTTWSSKWELMSHVRGWKCWLIQIFNYAIMIIVIKSLFLWNLSTIFSGAILVIQQIILRICIPTGRKSISSS